jgi:hypothetical protein
VEAAGARHREPLTARLIVGAMAMVAIGAGHGVAWAKVYTCIDPVSHAKTISDTPCPQATGPTPGELASQAKVAHDKEIAEEIQQAAVKADKQLLNRFPDEATHRKAHVVELDEVIAKIRFSTARFRELVEQRKPLDEEAAFYKGKPLPQALQRKIDASDASFNALTDVFHGLQSNVADIEVARGKELMDLRLLWAGARRIDGKLVLSSVSVQK